MQQVMVFGGTQGGGLRIGAQEITALPAWPTDLSRLIQSVAALLDVLPQWEARGLQADLHILLEPLLAALHRELEPWAGPLDLGSRLTLLDLSTGVGLMLERQVRPPLCLLLTDSADLNSSEHDPLDRIQGWDRVR